jgi:hypothetical protein
MKFYECRTTGRLFAMRTGFTGFGGRVALMAFAAATIFQHPQLLPHR